MAAASRDQPVEGEVEFHGDLLETVLSHVPLVDLVSASHVSKSWCNAVSSSLRHHNQPRPWLIIHTQGTRSPYATTTQAYDPRSNVWIKVSRPPIKYISSLQSSHSNFVYMLSPSRFSFSFDPLNFNWYHVDPPLVWRSDPIVARVGQSVVIAGGGCDFEDDPLAVEIYDLSTKVWHTCDSMPGSLRDVGASTWLSITATNEKLIVTDKESGVTHWFDPDIRSWSKPFNLGTGQATSSYNIGCTNNGLILIALCRIQNVDRVKVWRVDGEDFECEEIGEMPLEYVEKLRSESFGNCSINIRVEGNIVYVYNNAWDVEEVVACELHAGGRCMWWSVRNVVARKRMITERMVFTCSEIGIDELQRVMTVENRRLEVIL
ncbi:hypothetical protein CDL12_08336 [Handroanthus impetiginosus]|uniref:F-box domain-containing protein n=1 Tax=Handroanthus impetiginosus TaxID=429701 RepID=A0A2G9HN85_9LAMI|nr:hypothetical protein CDL12_08336 [Handroanthus impetiginosus]